jgi:T-complex protein 1 subunit delta
MDKMILTAKGQTLITNDGATILKNLSVLHPTAKILVEASKAQDVEAGDGTTSVVIIAGALLSQCENMLKRGIHPTSISDGFAIGLKHAIEILNGMATPIDLTMRDYLIQCVVTCLSSKILATQSHRLAPIAVDAVLRIMDPACPDNVDLNDIKIVKKLGGTIDELEVVEGLVFPDNRPSHSAGGPTKIVNPKIALIQFCLSSPKTDIENNIVVGDYSQIDKVLKEERKYIINLVKKIADSGCNVILLQKSVLRDAINELGLHFLAKKKIMLIKNIERQDVEFICKTIGCTPVAHIDQLTPEKLGSAELIEEKTLSDGQKILKCTGVPRECRTLSILLRGTNGLVVEETDRSLHDALCVVRCLIKNKSIIPGGGASEIEISQKLEEISNSISGLNQTIVKAFADAMETIPYTLAENFGLPPITLVTELRNKHKKGNKNCGLNAKTGAIVENCITQKIIQPTLVNESALTLATEVVRMILKIDDLVITR